jgi:hypothetical protein
VNLNDNGCESIFAHCLDQTRSHKSSGTFVRVTFQCICLAVLITDTNAFYCFIGTPSVIDVKFDVVGIHRFLIDNNGHAIVQTHIRFLVDIGQRNQRPIEAIWDFWFTDRHTRDDQIICDVIFFVWNSTSFAFFDVKIRFVSNIQVQRNFCVSHGTLGIDIKFVFEINKRTFHFTLQFVRFRISVSNSHHGDTGFVKDL